MDNNKLFLVEMGNRISKRRKELNFTQEQLAELMSLSLQSISCIELGKKAIRPDNLVNLCHALDVSADYILTGQKTAAQMSDITKKLSTLTNEDFIIIENLINRLSNKQF